MIKNQWDDYVEFIKQYQARVPFNTGGDNEPEPALLVEFEKLVNAYNDFCGGKVNKKNKLHNKKQKKLDASKSLRQAGLQSIMHRREEALSDLEEDSGTDSGKSSCKKPLRKKQAVSMPSSLMVEQHHEQSLAGEKKLKLELELLKQKNKATEIEYANAKHEMKELEYHDKQADNKEQKKLGSKKKMHKQHYTLVWPKTTMLESIWIRNWTWIRNRIKQ
jgi:hypothetical protein